MSNLVAVNNDLAKEVEDLRVKMSNMVAVNNDLAKENEDLRVKMRNMVAVNNDLAKENEDLRVKLSNVVADITELREKVDSIAADQGAIKEVLTEAADQRQAPETPFPLKSPAEMRHLESTITPDNQRSHVTEMSRILGQAHLRRSIRKVFSDEMIDAHNMDGTRGKSRLRNYPRIIECLLVNNDLGKDIEDLRVKMSNLVAVNNDLAKEVEDLRVKMSNMVAVNNDLAKENEDLRVKMRNMVAVNNDLAKEVEDLRVKMNNIVADMAELREKVDSIAADQVDIKEVLKTIAEAVVERPAPETSYPLKSLADMRHLESTITPDNPGSHVSIII
ncbi:uncharacterized protein Dwil_GK28072 [Drosophila willistoni]|uniref:DUF4806 domain-containing protein n=1 Tax=Drosophila willistoni TaxID=7260 RepID=A0A0Q9X0A8_DROWI|nr:uncharacterized protein Dwil_GK28072 [Drosophila willistoni]